MPRSQLVRRFQLYNAPAPAKRKPILAPYDKNTDHTTSPLQKSFFMVGQFSLTYLLSEERTRHVVIDPSALFFMRRLPGEG